jgi:antitoxin CptB
MLIPPVEPVFLERVRWRCRRGMLEMDILLERFVERRYAQMDEQQRVAFDELLDLPDTDLWDLVRGDKEPEQARQREVLEWLKQV